MPIYEYRCEECGHQGDHLQKISEPQLSVCPACHKPTYRKMLSAAGFHLKGSGWYATDFKGSGKGPSTGKKPASVLFDRLLHAGKPVSINELQGAAIAKNLAKAGKR